MQYENMLLMGDTKIDTGRETAAGKGKLTEFCDVFDLENLIKVIITYFCKAILIKRQCKL